MVFSLSLSFSVSPPSWPSVVLTAVWADAGESNSILDYSAWLWPLWPHTDWQKVNFWLGWKWSGVYFGIRCLRCSKTAIYLMFVINTPFKTTQCPDNATPGAHTYTPDFYHLLCKVFLIIQLSSLTTDHWLLWFISRSSLYSVCVCVSLYIYIYIYTHLTHSAI